MGGRRWTSEDDDTMREYWGCYGGIPALARRLDRKVSAVRMRAWQLGLGPWQLGSGLVLMETLLCVVRGTDTRANRLMIRRLLDAGFPAILRRTNTSRMRMVKIDDFWAWAEAHPDELDFSRFEENALGPEPAWAKRKRAIDRVNRYAKAHTAAPWSKFEEDRLRLLLQNGASYDDLVRELRRSQQAIHSRIYRLYLPPPERGEFRRWTKEEAAEFDRLRAEGYTAEAIAARIGRPASACAARIGYLKSRKSY